MAVPFVRIPIDPVWLVCLHKFKKEHDPVKLGDLGTFSLNWKLNKYPKRWRRQLKFYILKKWHEEKVQYSSSYISKLNSKIKKLGLYPFLLPAERDHITRLEEITFARKRVLKKLDVPFELENSEFCYFKFYNGEIFRKIDGIVRKQDSGELYITDKNIILVGVKSTVRIGILGVDILDESNICIIESNDLDTPTWYLKCEDMLLLNISLQRTLNIK